MKDSDAQPEPFDPRELAKMLQQMFNSGMDPSDLAKAAGLPTNPAALFSMFQNFSAAADTPASDTIDAAAVRKAALTALQQLEQPDAAAVARTTAALKGSLTLATAWLDRSTVMSAGADEPKFLDRTKWVTGSVDSWISFAGPVEKSINTALHEALQQQVPEQMRQLLAGRQGLFNRIGAALFAMQLGNGVGKFAGSVFGGGDIGVPVLTLPGHSGGSFVPVNIAEFIAELDNQTEMVLYLTIRELAHARLFRHAKWLRPHLESAIAAYARGIAIDVSHLESLAAQVDPHTPEAISELLDSGALIPPKTELQQQAHAEISHLLALVAGWVNVVTAQAAQDLPQQAALAELLRRRSATDGPAEKAFAALIGLELAPRRLREAEQLWLRIGELGGIELRDGLWEHPDLLPTIAELETPARLFERLGFADASPESVAEYDFDAELRKLLDGGFEAPPAAQ